MKSIDTNSTSLTTHK